MLEKFRNSALMASLLAFMPALVYAQAEVGTRAQGMAGAFVAVADDATAVYWNPAGVATGAFVSAVADFGANQVAAQMPEPATAQRHSSMFVGVSATAIGLAYYRAHTYGTSDAKAAVTGVQSREEVGHSVHAVATSVTGVALVQSLSEHLVVGVTPKWVRGTVDDLSDDAFDVDAGAMYYNGRIRLGVAARNLTAPAFANAAADDVKLSREVRAGAAWGSGWTGISRVIVAVDGDLRTRETPTGDRRDLAAGVETWWRNQRLGLRGGLSRSTIGEARAAVAAGVSAGLTQGMLLEAQVTRGHDDERSWSIGARMTF